MGFFSSTILLPYSSKTNPEIQQLVQVFLLWQSSFQMVSPENVQHLSFLSQELIKKCIIHLLPPSFSHPKNPSRKCLLRLKPDFSSNSWLCSWSFNKCCLIRLGQFYQVRIPKQITRIVISPPPDRRLMGEGKSFWGCNTYINEVLASHCSSTRTACNLIYFSLDKGSKIEKHFKKMKL